MRVSMRRMNAALREWISVLWFPRRDERLSNGVPAPSGHPLRPVFDALYRDMIAAAARRDADALRSLLMPDFRCVYLSGRSATAEEVIAASTAADFDCSRVTARTVVTDIALDGERAVVMQLSTMISKADVLSKIPREMWARSRDVWCKSGAWKIASSEMLKLELQPQAGVRFFGKRKADR